MTTQQIKALSNAVATLDIECGELILAPEGAQEHAINSQIAETLRVKVAAITTMIKAMSTPVDIAPSAPIGSALWNRHDVGWWPDYIPLFDRGPVTEIPDARERLQNAGVESPIDGLVYCAAILKKPNCMLGVCIFGDTGYEFQIPVVSTPVDVAPQVLPDPPSEIYLPLSSLSADEFITLVRAGKVSVETLCGEATAQVDVAGLGWARIGWPYELCDDDEYEYYYESTMVDDATIIQCDGNKLFLNETTFIIEQP